MMASKCLCVENGIITLVDGLSNDNAEEYKKLEDKDIAIDLAEYGLAIRLKDIIIPVPESILEHLIGSGNVYLYGGDINDYQLRPITSFTLSRDVLLEAKGVYAFTKQHV